MIAHMRYRVVQWGTGNTGSAALAATIGHPDLELVGVWVHSQKKAGRDAGDLVGVPDTGVLATNDTDAILALDADVVSYNASGDMRPHEAVDDMCRILAMGKNVISTSIVPLTYPPTGDKTMVSKLQAACEAGGTSWLTSGIDPGFANDQLPIVMAGWCEYVDTIRVRGVLNYATYDQAEILFDVMGFSKALDDESVPLFFPGALCYAWGGPINAMAAALGVELDDIRQTTERVAADHDIEVPSGHVPAGTTAAMRFEIQGMVGGEPLIVVEHVTRLARDLAPDWPQPVGKGHYDVTIEGNPSMTCTLQLEGTDGDENTGGVLATVMRLLNMIPAVVDAPPGVLSLFDLPLVSGLHLMRHGTGSP